jgi:tetratricopeptide (TPR) repeat protein
MKLLQFLSLAVALPLTFGFTTLPVDRLEPVPNVGVTPAITQIFPDISDPTIQLYLQAESFVSLGLTEEGIALYDQLLQELRAKGDRQEEARFLHSIASSFQLRGDLQRALTYYDQALTVAEAIPPDPRGQSVDLNEIANTIGAIYLVLGQNDQALVAYERAVAIDQKFALDWQGVGTFSNLGTAYRLTGNLEQALATYQLGITLAEATRDNYFRAKLFNKIGMLYQAQGEFELALAAYQQGLTAVANQPKEYQIVDLVLTLENISNLYRLQGQTEQAATYEQQVQEAIAQASEGFYGGDSAARGADFLEEIGEFYLLDGQPERAKEYFDRAVAIVHPMSDDYRELNLLNSILVHYRQWGQSAASIPYQQLQIERTKKMGQLESSAGLFVELGDLYQTSGQNESALAAYQQALTFYRESDRQHGEISGYYGFSTDEIVRTLRAIGKLYEVQDDPEQALTTYQEALNLYPAEQTYVSPAQIYLLDTLAKFYTTQGQTDQAQKYAEQAKISRDRLLTQP